MQALQLVTVALVAVGAMLVLVTGCVGAIARARRSRDAPSLVLLLQNANRSDDDDDGDDDNDDGADDDADDNDDDMRVMMTADDDDDDDDDDDNDAGVHARYARMHCWHARMKRIYA